MAIAKHGDTVRVHYTGTLSDGSVFDSSKDRDPLEFKLGENMVIAGFEQGIIGMNEGDCKTIDIPAAQAYGEVRPELVLKVERSEVPDDVKLEVGLELQIGFQEGGQATVVVTELDDQIVTLDANHPLAGKDLTFDVELVAVV